MHAHSPASIRLMMALTPKRLFLSLSLFMSISLLRLFSRAHYWVNKYILKMRVSSKELFSSLKNIYGLHYFWTYGRHFITMATVTPRRQPAHATLTRQYRCHKNQWFVLAIWCGKKKTAITMHDRGNPWASRPRQNDDHASIATKAAKLV